MVIGYLVEQHRRRTSVTPRAKRVEKGGWRRTGLRRSAGRGRGRVQREDGEEQDCVGAQGGWRGLRRSAGRVVQAGEGSVQEEESNNFFGFFFRFMSIRVVRVEAYGFHKWSILAVLDVGFTHLHDVHWSGGQGSCSLLLSPRRVLRGLFANDLQRKGLRGR